MESREDGENMMTTYLKTWSEKSIGTLINCFQSHKFLCNVSGGDYKDQIKKSLALEEVGMSMQEYEMNRYDYQKDGPITEANTYEIITDKITQRKNGLSN